jgi:hypothetical protein
MVSKRQMNAQQSELLARAFIKIGRIAFVFCSAWVAQIYYNSICMQNKMYFF